MIQYCKYCSNATAVDDDVGYCKVQRQTMSKKVCIRPNKCMHFIFNEKDVFKIKKRYNPRQEQTECEGQEKLF